MASLPLSQLGFFWLGRTKSILGGKRGRRDFKERSKGGRSVWCKETSVFNKSQKCPAQKRHNDSGFRNPEPLRFDENPVEAFEASGAREEWCTVMEELRDVRPRDSGCFGSHSLTPSKAVAQIFGYTSAGVFDCHVSSGSGCHGAIPCPEGRMDLESQRLILQSFVVLNEVSEMKVEVNHFLGSNPIFPVVGLHLQCF
jgi:hypothetical protein